MRYIRKINPINMIVKHLALLQKAATVDYLNDFEVLADEPLCVLIEHVEDGGWIPTKKQILSACRKQGLDLENLEYTYLRTIGKFREW